jgi:predicted transposase YbfD/YdcC
MPASPSSLIASLSPAPAGLCGLRPPELTVGLPAALADVPDPRARRGIRHRLAVVLTAAVCAVVAGYRSYTAIGERVADLPAGTALLLGIDTDRRPSEAMIRRLLQAVDPDLLAAAIGTWLATRIPEPAPGTRRAIAVDGKTIRGSRTRHTIARHAPAAADQHTGAVLASTDVDSKTNEITRCTALLDQIHDLDGAVVTADALHCQRDHVTYLAQRGAHWILTAKGNQPRLHQQLAGLPWRLVPVADRTTGHSHKRREIRTLKILSISTGTDFPQRRPGTTDPSPPTTARRTETLHHRDRLRDHRSSNPPSQTVAPGRLDPRPPVDREQRPPGPRRHLRRRPLPDPHRHRTPSHGHPPQRRHRRPTPRRRHQHRHRQPPPRPQPQPLPGPARHHLTSLIRQQSIMTVRRRGLGVLTDRRAGRGPPWC